MQYVTQWMPALQNKAKKIAHSQHRGRVPFVLDKIIRYLRRAKPTLIAPDRTFDVFLMPTVSANHSNINATKMAIINVSFFTIMHHQDF